MAIKKLIRKKRCINPKFIEDKLGLPKGTIEWVRHQGENMEIIFKEKAGLSETIKQKIKELIETEQYEMVEE